MKLKIACIIPREYVPFAGRNWLKNTLLIQQQTKLKPTLTVVEYSEFYQFMLLFKKKKKP